MAGVPDQTTNTPENKPAHDEPIIGGTEAEKSHRRMENIANKAANRASDRIKKDEAGHDEFSNIG
ncbi:MAG: hypothetical protein ABI164_00215, partial [Acidobacteriaceae bacterium]